MNKKQAERMTAEAYRDATPVPTEDEEQRRLFQWARMMSGRYPELTLMFHIPNGGSRRRVEAAILKGMGVKSGVPDIFPPAGKLGKHGLFIEMKRRKGGSLSEEQHVWLCALATQGYAVCVCKGYDEAIEQIKAYLGIPRLQGLKPPTMTIMEEVGGGEKA